MKTIILFVCLPILSIAQSALQEPVFYYMSKTSFVADTVPFQTGTVLQFRQQCTDKAPEFLYNETLGFNTFTIREIPFRLTVSFKDTVICRTHYYYKGKKTEEALAVFHLDKSLFWKQAKGVESYSGRRGNIFITCTLCRNELMYIEEMIDPKISRKSAQ